VQFISYGLGGSLVYSRLNTYKYAILISFSLRLMTTIAVPGWEELENQRWALPG
jgi:hypothetical protein